MPRQSGDAAGFPSGVVMVRPALGRWVIMTAAAGNPLVIIVINSASGLVAHARDAALAYQVTGTCTLAAVTGSLVAARLASRLPAKRLRRWYAHLVFAVAPFVAAQAVLNAAAG